MKDLTKGKPSKLILAFAIPIFMANILQLTYSIVDTRIVGSYLGENSLAAGGRSHHDTQQSDDRIFDGNGCVIYFYYNSRACSDIFV